MYVTKLGQVDVELKMKQAPPIAFTLAAKCNIQPRQTPGLANGDSPLNAFSPVDLPGQDIQLHWTTLAQSSPLHGHLAPLRPLSTACQARWANVQLCCTREMAENSTSRSRISNGFIRRAERVKALAPKQHHCLKCTLGSLLNRIKKSPEAETLPSDLIFLSKRETIVKIKPWQSLYSKSEHLHLWIVFGFL